MPPERDRNSFSLDGWELRKLEETFDKEFLEAFDCGNQDLNEYFKHDALLNREQLIGQVYCLTFKATDDDAIPVALIDFCNDAVRKRASKGTPGYEQLANFSLDDEKRYPTLPAVKISRLGVDIQWQHSDVGTNLLNLVKKMFVTNNRTGCRFITVDAYNHLNVLNFYSKNGFILFHDADAEKRTRAMCYDLKGLRL